MKRAHAHNSQLISFAADCFTAQGGFSLDEAALGLAVADELRLLFQRQIFQQSAAGPSSAMSTPAQSAVYTQPCVLPPKKSGVRKARARTRAILPLEKDYYFNRQIPTGDIAQFAFPSKRIKAPRHGQHTFGQKLDS